MAISLSQARSARSGSGPGWTQSPRASACAEPAATATVRQTNIAFHIELLLLPEAPLWDQSALQMRRSTGKRHRWNFARSVRLRVSRWARGAVAQLHQWKREYAASTFAFPPADPRRYIGHLALPTCGPASD